MGNVVTGLIGRMLPEKTKRSILRSFLGDILVRQTKSSTKSIFSFLGSKNTPLSFNQRVGLIKKYDTIRKNVRCAHSTDEILIPTQKILEFDNKVKGVIVEAGAFRGGSTAKLSVVAKISSRKLHVFDSFEGLPDNDEPTAHTKMGYTKEFKGGEYAGSITEVKKNVRSQGEIGMCEFHKGWFDKTMPSFKKPVVAVLCDVDLASSTKTALTHMWPRLVSGGYFFTQDAHVDVVMDVFADKKFWKSLKESAPPAFVRVTNRFGYIRKA